MPPKRKGDEGGSVRTKKRRMPEKGTEEYLFRRERNNEAVKKSRDKSRAKAKETVTRVNQLKEENEKLEEQVKILSKELGVLKDLFRMAHTGGSNGDCPGTETGIQTEAEELPMPETCKIEQASSPVNEEALQRDHEYSLSPFPMTDS